MTKTDDIIKGLNSVLEFFYGSDFVRTAALDESLHAAIDRLKAMQWVPIDENTPKEIFASATCGHSGRQHIIKARWASAHGKWVDVEETHLAVSHGDLYFPITPPTLGKTEE